MNIISTKLFLFFQEYVMFYANKLLVVKMATDWGATNDASGQITPNRGECKSYCVMRIKQ